MSFDGLYSEGYVAKLEEEVRLRELAGEGETLADYFPQFAMKVFGHHKKFDAMDPEALEIYADLEVRWRKVIVHSRIDEPGQSAELQRIFELVDGGEDVKATRIVTEREHQRWQINQGKHAIKQCEELLVQCGKAHALLKEGNKLKAELVLFDLIHGGA